MVLRRAENLASRRQYNAKIYPLDNLAIKTLLGNKNVLFQLSAVRTGVRAYMEATLLFWRG